MSAEVPAHLKGKDLAGNFGFDPLSLGKDEAALKWYTQAELQNGRWAMLGVAGILVQELLHKTGLGGKAADVYWFDAGNNTFWAPKETLIAISFLLFAWAECNRAQDYFKPGSNVSDPFGNSIKYVELGYPGFDPLSFTKNDYAGWKLKEIKNGRLAMLAFLGFVAQHNAQPGSPLDQLADHLSNPWKNHFVNNGVSLPFLTDTTHNLLGGTY
ncbi:hypothetical protein CHLNCDRAFT_50418 [Chlorella variabilis]|uniref:Chlorophyll a-b binding protein, chloroplastic n=1 Tax=Chlorella variabilis TaxID=554065 RepID=E1Z687_CHLVA|nr:hypothetical protein CHLNCDRAFT_50418 [Chlorella variabilis]EFN58607.1 hypothetical protein CHLNCDRAFT_50418 [Chlorella variabilis]|eukprot:XP_005850709.1 hypothetical protein CHLNCDRAFT_50418 [Chlorella variabilis]